MAAISSVASSSLVSYSATASPKLLFAERSAIPATFYGLRKAANLSEKPSSSRVCSRRVFLRCQAVQDTKEAESNTAEDITQKYGLEAGLWKIFSSKDKNDNGSNKKSRTDEAKELLAKYGGAYLATSISLSLVSFGLCYALVSAGIDVQALLQKVGISAGETGEKVGTFALAYAAHKAASPIRFPPTVALTPIVASWIGKTAKKGEGQ